MDEVIIEGRREIGEGTFEYVASGAIEERKSLIDNDVSSENAQYSNEDVCCISLRTQCCFVIHHERKCQDLNIQQKQTELEHSNRLDQLNKLIWRQMKRLNVLITRLSKQMLKQLMFVIVLLMGRQSVASAFDLIVRRSFLKCGDDEMWILLWWWEVWSYQWR